MRATATGATLLALLLIATPVQAQPSISVDCDSVDVTFRTSIQPDSATVEITSDAGAETHSVTLVQGGTDTVTFPLDGQNGELVSVTVTLVYRGQPNAISATQILADCPAPSSSLSPSPQPTVEPSPEPSPSLPDGPAAVPGILPPSPLPSPMLEAALEDAIEEIADAVVITRSDETTESLPEELAFTGPGRLLGLILLAGSFLTIGLTARRTGRRLGREAGQLIHQSRRTR